MKEYVLQKAIDTGDKLKPFAHEIRELAKKELKLEAIAKKQGKNAKKVFKRTEKE